MTFDEITFSVCVDSSTVFDDAVINGNKEYNSMLPQSVE